jgi:Tol biopolymer transport system component
VKRVACGAALALAVGAAPAHATLAYVKGLLSGKPVVWVAADDGSGARSLAAGGFSPRVSPDGLQVAYVIGSRRTALKIKPAAGGTAVTVATGVWSYDAIQWSADGTMLSAITGPELGPYTLRLFDLVGGTSRVVAKGYFFGVSFAPSGEGLAFARSFTNSYPVKANLYVVDLLGGPVHKITSDANATEPVWGPALIAFNRAHRPARRGDYDKLEIYTILPDGSGLRRLTKTNPPFLLAGLTPLAWSDDGQRLAAEYGGQDTSEVWRVSGDTGKAADATGGFDGVVGWGLSGDGTTLLATTGYFDNPKGDVVALAWDGGAQTVLARRATQPSWSR